MAGLLLLAPGAQAQSTPWVADRLDDEAVESVWVYVNHKDCAGAAKTLSAGIAKGYPGVLLLGGAMFEHGICLKPSWERAVDFYQRAHAAGHPRAAARIVSGYATPAAGPDKAAVLWWAMREKHALPGDCKVAADLVDDPDRFVQTLQSWTSHRLDACAYVAAVMATITGDLEFSQRAASHGLKGVLSTTFHPAENKVEVDTQQLEFVVLPGRVSGDAMRDRDSRSVKQEFERDIRTAADRALRRYAKPSNIDPSWRVTAEFRFGYVFR